jgi:hypothetical protein
VVQYVLGPILGIDPNVINSRYGQNLKLDTTRAIKELEMTFQPLGAALEEIAELLFTSGGLERK